MHRTIRGETNGLPARRHVCAAEIIQAGHGGWSTPGSTGAMHRVEGSSPSLAHTSISHAGCDEESARVGSSRLGSGTTPGEFSQRVVGNDETRLAVGVGQIA